MSANSPLYISQAFRSNGLSTLVVQNIGNPSPGNLVATVGQKLQVMGVSDPSFNGTFVISQVVNPDTIRYLQPGQHEVRSALVGGAVSVG
jgi:hypothetical protein